MPASAASLFLSEARGGPLEILRQRGPPHHGARLAPPRAHRWHQNPIMTPARYSGFLLHFLAMFSNPPMSPFSQTDLSSSDSTETEVKLMLLKFVLQKKSDWIRLIIISIMYCNILIFYRIMKLY